MRCNFQVFEYQKWAAIYKKTMSTVHALSFTITQTHTHATHCIFPSFTLHRLDSHSVLKRAHFARFFTKCNRMRTIHIKRTLHFMRSLILSISNNSRISSDIMNRLRNEMKWQTTIIAISLCTLHSVLVVTRSAVNNFPCALSLFLTRSLAPSHDHVDRFLE